MSIDSNELARRMSELQAEEKAARTELYAAADRYSAARTQRAEFERVVGDWLEEQEAEKSTRLKERLAAAVPRGGEERA